MRGSRWKRVKDLLEEVAGVANGERGGYLARACGGDAELQAEVESLLSHDGSASRSGFLEPPHRLPEPRRHVVGELEIVRELGRGGMGVVYLARQASLAREVAVKVLVANLTTTDEEIERFHREARAAARLSHPGIVPVFAEGVAGETHWFSMEYVAGHDLDRELALQRGAAPREGERRLLPAPGEADHVARAAGLCADVAEALHYAHERGVVHRDVKPHNLLVGLDGRVRLVDFGLARDVLQHGLTRAGNVLCTPSYMSPEQTRIGAAGVDRRSDVFSLGVVLYELLTLHRPFEGRTLDELVRKIRSEEPVPVRARRRSVPRDLEAVCAKALAKRADRRYATAGELAFDLRCFLRFEAVQARPLGALHRTGRWLARRRLPLAGALLLAVGLAAGAWSAGERAREASRNARAERLRTIADVPDWSAVPLDRLLHARRDLEAARGEGRQDLAAELELRFRGLHAGWKREGVALLDRGLGHGLGADGLGIDDAAVLHGFELLLRAAFLFPEDASVLALASRDLYFPRVSVVAAEGEGTPLAGSAAYRPIDPITGQPGSAVALGELPLVDAPVPPGMHRIVVQVRGGGAREYTRILARGGKERIMVAARPQRASTAGMVRFEGGVLALRDPSPSLSSLNGRDVAVEPFWLDAAEVSNAEYRDFLEATGHPAPPLWELVAPGSPEDDLPVVFVSWLDARAFAEWAGKRLPTHAEATWAFRGAAGRAFPWTDAASLPPDAYLGNTRQPTGAGRDKRASFEHYLRHAAPVRSHPEACTPDGLFHALGNVAEWTESVLAEPELGRFVPRWESRVVVGGFWDAAQRGDTLRNLAKAGPGDASISHTRGFRCALGAAP